jgi:hypothetical protein
MNNQNLDISDDELLAVEKRLLEAFAKRSADGLNTLGFGEVGVPLAWPDNEPRLCVKRLNMSKSAKDVNDQIDAVREYMSAVEPHVDLVPTDLRTVVNDVGATAVYLVQPVIPRNELLENVLEDTTPTVDHPALVALREASVAVVKERKVALDTQVSNFRWTDGKLSFFDVGTPFRLDAAGEAMRLPESMFSTVPKVARELGNKAATKVVNDFASPSGNLRHAAISIARLGLDDWIGPAVETFNQVIDGEPLVADDIRGAMDGLQKDMKVIKNLMKAQRFWAENVRRQPYDSFILDSFSGEFL